MRRWLAVGIVSCVIGVPAVGGQRFMLSQNWRDYGPRDRYEALRNYRQYQSLPNERREDLQKNYERWRAMPQQERERIRQNYERYRQLPPEQRNQLRERYRAQKR